MYLNNFQSAIFSIRLQNSTFTRAAFSKPTLVHELLAFFRFSSSNQDDQLSFEKNQMGIRFQNDVASVNENAS